MIQASAWGELQIELKRTTPRLVADMGRPAYPKLKTRIRTNLRFHGTYRHLRYVRSLPKQDITESYECEYTRAWNLNEFGYELLLLTSTYTTMVLRQSPVF